MPSVESEEAPVVRCGTSQNLSFLPDASVDLVLTDPPYFDNIAYSELAEFFLPWLRLLEVVSPDSGLEQVMLDSLGGRRGDVESLMKYKTGLSGVFSEVTRVLKPPASWSSATATRCRRPGERWRALLLPTRYQRFGYFLYREKRASASTRTQALGCGTLSSSSVGIQRGPHRRQPASQSPM